MFKNHIFYDFSHKNEPERGIYVHRLKTHQKVVGAKQTAKVLENNQAEVVYVAKDADERVVRRVLELAKERNVPIVMVETMTELGKACNVEVKTAAAVVIK